MLVSHHRKKGSRRARDITIDSRINDAIDRYFRAETEAYPTSWMGRMIDGTMGTSGAYRPHVPRIDMTSTPSGVFRGATAKQIHACRLRYTWRATPVEYYAPGSTTRRVVTHERNHPTYKQCADHGGWPSENAFKKDLNAARTVVLANLLKPSS